MDSWWVYNQFYSGGAAAVLGCTFWVIGSITLHELAHGWAALQQGDDTPRVSGHMTANPWVHMGGFSLLMFALIGIAWGAMPVNPSRFRHRYGDAIVSAAGPAINLALAILAFVLYILLIQFGSTWDAGMNDRLQGFLIIGMRLNLVLLFLNLLPIPPLDGSRIIASFSPEARRIYESPQMASFSMMLLLGVFFIFGHQLFRAADITMITSLNFAAEVLGWR